MKSIRFGPSFILGLLSLSALSGHAASYYVDGTNGSDSYTATQAQSVSTPWKTIQKAATTLSAGDTVYIRAGVYRETVTPANSGLAGNPILYLPYNSESVTVSGLNVVSTSWTQYSGNIYYTSCSLGMGDKNAVFVNGAFMTLARWPNKSSADPLFSVSGDLATATGGGSGTLTDSTMPNQSTNWYNGATIWVLASPSWNAWAKPVTGSGGGTLTFTQPTDPSWLPQAASGTRYFLSNALGLLDVEKEWYYDSTAQRLYLYQPGGGSPNGSTVEVKARDLGFDLTGISYVTVQNINMVGAMLKITGDHNTIDGMTATYTFTHNGNNMGWTFPASGTYDSMSGMIIAGNYNTVKNGTFAYSAGRIFTLSGTYDTIDNNTIHDADYLGAWDGAIGMQSGGGNRVTRNSMYKSGRSLIDMGGTHSGAHYIMYNDASQSMLLSDDGGPIYTAQTNLLNTIVAYNNFHDEPYTWGTLHPGMYFDDNTSNYVAHHNVIYNVNSSARSAVQSGAGSTGRYVYNTTCYNGPTNFLLYHNGGSGVVGNTLHNAASTNFVNAASHDFRLVSTSSAVDAGTQYSPYTDGYTGTNPDNGAYEYNGPAKLASWTAGVGSTIYDSQAIAPTGDSNLVIGATLTASSTDTANGYSPAKAADGNTADFAGWSSSGTVPQWLLVDFGVSKTFNRVELYTTTNYALYDYDIQQWNGSTYSTIVQVRGNTAHHITSTFTAVTSSRIRINCITGDRWGLARVDEIQAYYDTPNPNLATGATLSASSTDTANGYSPAKAADGNTASFAGWCSSGSVTQWLLVDFGSAESVGRVELYTTAGYLLTDYDIQQWNGSSYVTIVQVRGNAVSHVTSTFTAVSTSRIRINCLGGDQWGLARIDEIQIYAY